MNTYTSARVGSRQWAMLRVADDAYPGAVSLNTLACSPGDGMPPSFHKPVIESLLAGHLLEHLCPSDDHAPSGTCALRITERGAWARLAKPKRAVPQL